MEYEVTDIPPRVSVGRTVMLDYGGGDPIATKVGKPCDQDVGHWFCADHREHFANNWVWNNHLDSGSLDDHTAVWICHEHGPEQP